MTNKFYLTSTLPYVNASPHVAHAWEFFMSDVIVRYKRQKLGEENVFFNTGIDEHGLKIYQKALDNDKTPQEYVDHFAQEWKEFCKLALISYDNFYRTSDKSHHKAAQKFWKEVDAKGDIYKKKYTGLYCVGCESFKTEKDLVDGKCPDHQKEPIEVSEENYFFKLSKYRDHLLNWLDDNPDFVKPPHKNKELRNFIENIEDISISRKKENLPWGIEVPGDPEQVMYVWFDALTDYIIAVGYGETEGEVTSPRLQEWWPAEVQVCGPDNLRFQGGIWQGMLASVGLGHTKRLLVHGMMMAEDGSKMSKTIGNVVNPIDLLNKYGPEPVRYFFTAGIPTYDDTNFSHERLESLYNEHLANNYGNLLNRVLHLAKTKNMETRKLANLQNDFKQKVDSEFEKFEILMEDYDLSKAYEVISRLTAFGNQYITEQEPWAKEKSEDEVTSTLQNLIYLLRKVTEAYKPVIPESAEKAEKALESGEKVILFEKI